jgi:hypothetical protein
MIDDFNIAQSEINNSPILKTMFDGSDKPTVFMPNFGDFGPVIHKLIKIVHFFECPKKIICCKRGEEAYYPSADEFYYDWDNFVEEKHRWAFFSKGKITSIGKNEKYNYYKKKYVKNYNKIKSHYGDDLNYIHLYNFNVDYVFEKYDNLFKFKLNPANYYNVKTDIVIVPRKRESRKQSNFMQWEKVIGILNDHGYSVGCVGSEEESFKLKNSKINSWDYDDNSSAAIELLNNCKLYLGLDTGVSHLAAFMSTPMIIFSDANPKLYASNYLKRMTSGYFLDLGKNVRDTSVVTSAALDYLGKQNA